MTRLLYLPDDLTIIQLTIELTPSEISAAVNAGMRPLPILRSAPPGKLLCGVVGGTVIIAPARGPGRPPAANTKPDLTRRQTQVLELSSRGFSSEEIASILGISRRAVNYHLAQVRSRIRFESSPGVDYQLEE
jgi:DNA-binding CsgD family transcriptional regulator